jgi:hypothetical protein
MRDGSTSKEEVSNMYRYLGSGIESETNVLDMPSELSSGPFLCMP